MFINQNKNKLFIPILLLCILLSACMQNIARAFTDGDNAIDLIGHYVQNDGVAVDYTESSANDAPGLYGLSSAGYNHAIDTINHRLFIADSGNNRVLVFNLNNSNQLVDKTPDNVLGQSSLYKGIATTTQAGMNTPSAVAYDEINQRLFVAQSGNHRVTVYDVSSITDGENAINVLGQSTFTASSSAATQSGMSSPVGLAYSTSTQRLFVSQSNISRVTVYDVTSITDGENAINVLGQTTFTGSSGAHTQGGMDNPQGMAYDEINQRLFVAQYGNHRVTVYDVSSITDGENAINVLGQTTFTGASASVTQGGMSAPSGLAYSTSTQLLFVSQSNANRVTVYDVASITNGENAVNVLGQTLFTDSTATTTQSGLNNPRGIVYDAVNQRLFVAQSIANRVTVYDVASITNGEDAIDLIGHYVQNDGVTVDYIESTANDGAQSYGLNLSSSVYGLAIDTTHHRLFVPESGNNRVLVFNLNNSNFLVDKTPDNVLGQSNFYTHTAATTQSGMSAPQSVAYDDVNQRLFVAQSTNSQRVTVYDVSSITDGENAINVLGQSTFTGGTGGTTQASFSTLHGLAYDSVNQRLFVAERSNNRVTVFDVSSITDGEDAINVLGQSTFITSSAANTQAGMSGPRSLVYDSVHNRLFVGGATNNRVTVYDVASITDGENAINVLGQTTFTGASASVTQGGMSAPSGLAYDSVNQRLFVADTSNQRMTVYDVSSITDGEDAIGVLGQSTFTGKSSAVTQSGVTIPQGMVYDNSTGLLYVSNGGSNRVTIYDAGLYDMVELSTASSSSTNETTANNFPVLLVRGIISSSQTVDVAITAGTATADTDYTSSTTVTVTIPAGSYDGSTSTAITITVPTLIQDTSVEGSETILLTLSNPSAGIALGDANQNTATTSTSTYTITDDDSESSNTVTATATYGPGPTTFSSGIDYSYVNPIVAPVKETASISNQNLYIPILKTNQTITLTSKNNIDEIKRLETFLNTHEKENVIVNGVFEKKDQDAIKRFQKKYAHDILKPSGINTPTGNVGSYTIAKINLLDAAKNITCPYFSVNQKIGSVGTDVKKIQGFLNIILGTNTAENSTYSQITLNSVKAFQKKYNVTSSGNWYKKTRGVGNQLIGCGK